MALEPWTFVHTTTESLVFVIKLDDMFADRAICVHMHREMYIYIYIYAIYTILIYVHKSCHPGSLGVHVHNYAREVLHNSKGNQNQVSEI